MCVGDDVLFDTGKDRLPEDTFYDLQASYERENRVSFFGGKLSTIYMGEN